jgi:hypothetical protein
MSVKELKEWIVKCDVCKEAEHVVKSTFPPTYGPPKGGWQRVTYTLPPGHGRLSSAGFNTRAFDVCPPCQVDKIKIPPAAFSIKIVNSPPVEIEPMGDQ